MKGVISFTRRMDSMRSQSKSQVKNNIPIKTLSNIGNADPPKPKLTIKNTMFLNTILQSKFLSLSSYDHKVSPPISPINLTVYSSTRNLETTTSRE